MKVAKHHNYYTLLLNLGATIVNPLSMVPENDTSKGRMWYAHSVLRLRGMEYHLEARFFGNKAETEEVAAANLIIDHIVMSVEGGNGPDDITLTRKGFVLLMLQDGVYTIGEPSKEIADKVRKIVTYSTVHYMGIPAVEEFQELRKLGYNPVILWEDF